MNLLDYKLSWQDLVKVLPVLVLAELILLVAWLKWQKRQSLPSYKEIPATILSHMASKQELRELDGTIDYAIVGSGVGALATASILSRFYKVAVFEQHYTVGGSTHTFKANKDYNFDVGVHYVGGYLDRPWSGMKMIFDWLTDGKLEFAPIDKVLDVAYNNATGERIEFTGDPKMNRAALLKHFPDLEPVVLDRYYRKCRQARAVAYLSFVLKGLPPFMTSLVWKMGYGALYRRFCSRKTLDVMKECGLSTEVIGAITYCYGDYGTPPGESPFFMQAFMECHYDGGAFFPKGGSSSIAKTMVAAITRRGGKVFAASPVEHILTMQRFGHHVATGVRVKGVDVKVRKGVISDAGFSKTFEVGQEGDLPLVDQVASAEQLRLVHHKEVEAPFHPSPAFFYLFVGLNGSDKELGLIGQNIWHVQGWDHDRLMKKLMGSKNVAEALKDPPPLVFLSNESAKDPDFAKEHPDKAMVTIIGWTNPHWFHGWAHVEHDHRGEAYEAIKEKMKHELLGVLFHHFPLTKGRVDYAEIGSPLTADKYLGRQNGEIYNLDHSASRFDSLEAHLALHPQTKIRNLFLVGQDVCTVSVESATMSAFLATARASTPALLLCIPITLALVFGLIV